MGLKLLGFMLERRGAVTAALLFGFLLNVFVVGFFDAPAEQLDRDLPIAAQCQGGGAGCAEQPLIPPPAIGMPSFVATAPVSFGALVPIEAVPPQSLREILPLRPDRPPLAALAA